MFCVSFITTKEPIPKVNTRSLAALHYHDHHHTKHHQAQGDVDALGEYNDITAHIMIVSIRHIIIVAVAAQPAPCHSFSLRSSNANNNIGTPYHPPIITSKVKVVVVIAGTRVGSASIVRLAYSRRVSNI